MTRAGKSRRKLDSNPGSSAREADALSTRPAKRFRMVRSRTVYLTISHRSFPMLPTFVHKHVKYVQVSEKLMQRFV